MPFYVSFPLQCRHNTSYLWVKTFCVWLINQILQLKTTNIRTTYFIFAHVLRQPPGVQYSRPSIRTPPSLSSESSSKSTRPLHLVASLVLLLVFDGVGERGAIESRVVANSASDESLSLGTGVQSFVRQQPPLRVKGGLTESDDVRHRGLRVWMPNRRLRTFQDLVNRISS